MEILFYGRNKENCGPENVNKGIAANLTPRFKFASTENKYIHMLEALWKLLGSQVVVASGVSRKGCILFRAAKLLGKKTVYIMHGDVAFETIINNLHGNEKHLIQETCLLENADLILPVSEKFMYWVHDRYPQYADKTKYLYNGIDKSVLKCARCANKITGSIIAAGADREIKNNIVVARVVEQMAGNVHFDVYGHIYHEKPSGLKHTQYHGVVPNDVFLEKLAESKLFVLNSVLEAFGISAIEALLCGCSVLLSEVAGVTGILNLEESDIIHDPNDEEEIKAKIEYLLEHPNNERILSKLDLDEWSFEKMVQRLEMLCLELAGK